MPESSFDDLMGELARSMFDAQAAKIPLDTCGWKLESLGLPPGRASTYVCPAPWHLGDPAIEVQPVRNYTIDMEGWNAEWSAMLRFEFYMEREVPTPIREAVLALLPPNLTTPPAMWEQFPGEPDTYWGIRWERGDRSTLSHRWIDAELYPDGQIEWMFFDHADGGRAGDWQGDRETGDFNTLATTDIARFRACLAKVLDAT